VVAVKSITLDQDALFGWEAQDFNFAVKASAKVGRITEYRFDVNNDGIFDHTAKHEPKISGAVEFDLPLLHLIGSPADDGEYPATVRVCTNWGFHADFPVQITIGNMPPEITISAGEDGKYGEPFGIGVTTQDPGPDTVKEIVIEWGDGFSSTISGGAGSVSHVYSKDRQYTIRATATDEDGSVWSQLIVDIGDTDPKSVQD